ncbi:hypothetical protein [Staphylococcus canis]|uniref:Phage protein n=1 Tax=Staphylococcus canis TaxID=2724942 RepID=A0ABS0TBS2_9STAP|nr:hypothetical protein [Staphylococcus canis]MBI5975199.1 hypothetical protein [Staphylococcus canis]
MRDSNAIKEHEERVNQEKERLNKIFKEIPDDKKKATQGLIIQAARMRVLLDDAWIDIQKNGDYELFTQSENTPAYERERPIAKLYNSRDASYQKIIQQLIKLLPDEVVEEKKADNTLKGLLNNENK